MQNLIDLAGSESSRAETTGMRRREGSYINKSLLTLGTVRSQTLLALPHSYQILFFICDVSFHKLLQDVLY